MTVGPLTALSRFDCYPDADTRCLRSLQRRDSPMPSLPVRLLRPWPISPAASVLLFLFRLSVFLRGFRHRIEFRQLSPLFRAGCTVLQSCAPDDAHFPGRIHHNPQIVFRSAQENYLDIIINHQISSGLTVSLSIRFLHPYFCSSLTHGL